MDRARNAIGFGLFGVAGAALGLWISGARTTLAWIVAGAIVAANVFAGYTLSWRIQLGLLMVAGFGIVAFPFTKVDAFGGREAVILGGAAVAVVVSWALIYRRAIGRSWEERWIDAPFELEIDAVDDIDDDRGDALHRLGFTASHAYRLTPDEELLAVVYVHESQRIYAEVTFPRRDRLNAGWSFTSLSGSVSLSTQQTRGVPPTPGELIQAFRDHDVEEGYHQHVETMWRLHDRGLVFDAPNRAAYRTHIRREASIYRLAFRDNPYRQIRMTDRVRAGGDGYSTGPLFDQPDVETQLAAALRLSGVERRPA